MHDQHDDDFEQDPDSESQEERIGGSIFFRQLTSADVTALLSIDELIDAMDGALRQFSAGQVEQPVRTVVPIGDQKVFGVMPAYVRAPGAIGAKLVTVFGGNAAL